MSRRLLSTVCLLWTALAAAAQQPGAGDADGWWAYRPLQRPAVPEFDDDAAHGDAWVANAIDAFVLRGLRQRGLEPAAPADRHTLLRRVTYDLTGLPPTQAEIDAFVADRSPDAYAKVVERLLASPQYGVKWAQHWLDVVRYAETDGYERDSTKPMVWRYRDWVVDALNADMPYGEFVTRQLAGDELPNATVADRIATGFYRIGIWDDEPTDRAQHLYDVYDGIADTAARATMAVSMGCARCHDHKKDPLPTREYYGFLAFFENITPYEKKAEVVPEDGADGRLEQAMARYAAKRAVLCARLAEVAEAARSDARAGAAAGPVAAWTADRTSATELIDAVGGHHGVVHGQIVAVPDGEGAGYRFDGDDHAVVPRVVARSFSVGLRVRTTDRGPGRPGDPRWFHGAGLVDGDVEGAADDWGVAWSADGRITAGVGEPESLLSSHGGLDDGAWHDVVFTRDMATGRIALYVDGRLCGEKVASKRPLDAPPDLYIGRRRTGGRGFSGDLDDIVLFDRALTGAEVVALAIDARGGVAAGPALEHGAADAVAGLLKLRPPELGTVEVLAVREHGPRPKDAFVRIRGNVHAQGSPVEPTVPSMLGAGNVPEAEPTGHSTGRRLALAKWLVREDHPLTWRVIANRLWQHHFGRGIVRSSNDFGRLGERPTHPELLDWLACEVLARGQSLKAMHRLLVTSQTYRMSSEADPRALAEDPLNDGFWRFDRRRLTAEEVRDSILAVNGTLNPELRGPSVYPPLPRAVLLTASRPDQAWGRSTPEQAARRSIYVHVKRSLPEPLLASFDRADTDASCPVRFATVQPTQALTMVNGDFANEQARIFAERLRGEADGLEAQLRRGLELVTQRPARDGDAARLCALADDLRGEFGRTEAEALQRCCLVLLNCNEFLFLD